MLAHSFPMCVLWGADLLAIYNDAYRASLGDRHTSLLGRPLYAVWPEARAANEALFAPVWRGETVGLKDAHHLAPAHRRSDDAWFDGTVSPLFDDAGDVAGILSTAFETTERVLARSALQDAEARHRTELEGQIAARTAELGTSHDLLRATMDASTDLIQVFEAVRDKRGRIVDFLRLLNNRTSEALYGEVRAKSA